MAILTNSNDLIVVHSKHRIPLSSGAVASLANLGRIGMSWGFVIKVTGFADAIDLGVVHRVHGNPRCIVVARLTHVRGIDMGSGFTGCSGTIVTIYARLPQDSSVIELRIPISGIVARIARFRGG
jgi:hypothetical protein